MNSIKQVLQPVTTSRSFTYNSPAQNAPRTKTICEKQSSKPWQADLLHYAESLCTYCDLYLELDNYFMIIFKYGW